MILHVSMLITQSVIPDLERTQAHVTQTNLPFDVCPFRFDFSQRTDLLFTAREKIFFL